MALVKPIAQGISAFDATQDQTFSFTSSGGSQVVANQITIRLQDDNSVVYQNKVETYRFEQIVPANTLTNGNYYNFYFNTYDVGGNESEDSNVIQFYCFSNPTLTLTNLPLNNLVESSSYTFGVTYNQTQGELLNYLKFYLYDNLDNLITESDFYYGKIQTPISFEHTFNGFENNGNYKVEVISTSINGIVTSSGKYSFTTKYFYPQLYSLLNLENVCDEGYVKVENNVVISDGEICSDFNNPHYIKKLDVSDPNIYVKWGEQFTYDMSNHAPISGWTSPSLLDIHEYDNWVSWSQGYNIKQNFTFTIFMKVGILGRFAVIGTETNGFTIDLIREIPYGETEVKDRFEVNGYVNGVLKVHQTSNYVDIINQHSYYLRWFRKNGNDYDLRFDVISSETDVMEWGTSNIEFERVSDFIWADEEYDQGVEFVPMAQDVSEIFPLFALKLYNGIYDNIDVTNNVSREFTTDIPSWDYDTRLNCDFNGNINGGNVDILMSTLKYIRIKRRKKGSFNWITIKQYEINSFEDLVGLITEDYYVPSNYETEYALVPVLDGDVEGDYVINGIDTKFNCVTIADSTNAFSLRANISYGGDTKNAPMGTYTPLKGKYPIIQKNSELEYWSGSISAMMLGYEFQTSKKIDRNSIVQQTNDFCEFLNNMEAKIIKDWNGKIHLVRFVGSPTVSYANAYGNGIAQVTANWVEQGQFDSQDDLYNNGLVDTK